MERSHYTDLVRNRNNLLLHLQISFFLSSQNTADTMQNRAREKQCLSMNFIVKHATPSLIFTQNLSPQIRYQSVQSAKK